MRVGVRVVFEVLGAMKLKRGCLVSHGLSRLGALNPKTLNLGYCPPPVTVYIRGPIKSYI